ncbi:MAG: hypothetical protein AAFV53_00785 [Myxococcota bacterium]
MTMDSDTLLYRLLLGSAADDIGDEGLLCNARIQQRNRLIDLLDAPEDRWSSVGYIPSDTAPVFHAIELLLALDDLRLVCSFLDGLIALEDGVLRFRLPRLDDVLPAYRSHLLVELLAMLLRLVRDQSAHPDIIPDHLIRRCDDARQRYRAANAEDIYKQEVDRWGVHNVPPPNLLVVHECQRASAQEAYRWMLVEVVRILLTRACFTGVHTLDLAWMGMRQDALTLLRPSSLEALRVLDLRGNGLRARDVVSMVCSPRLSGVEALYLQQNQLDDEGVKALAWSPNVRRLRHLDLRHNHIGRAGFHALADTPHLRQLQWLSLRTQDVHQHGAAVLAASKTLPLQIRRYWRVILAQQRFQQISDPRQRPSTEPSPSLPLDEQVGVSIDEHNTHDDDEIWF